jgi:flagellar biosynthesis component FlhA
MSEPKIPTSEGIKKNEQKATAIVNKILQMLIDENVSIHDAQRLLHAADMAIQSPLFTMVKTTVVSMPAAITWSSFTRPDFN